MATYSSKQLIQIPFPTDGLATISLRCLEAVDKIRISCFDNLIMTDFTPGVLIWSNLVNNYIGTAGCDLSIGTYNFQKELRPSDGITYSFTHKMILNGDYQVRFENFFGAVPSGITNDIVILIEYYIY